MGIQKYRADKAKPVCDNGAIEWYSEWSFGPTLAMIEDCPIGNTDWHQYVYIQGEADTYFTIPAAINVRGRRVMGFVTRDESGPTFHPYHY